MSEDRGIKLGGRAYRSVAVSTVQRDVFVMARVRAAGLDSMPVESGESPEEYTHRVLSALLGSPGVLELIGALLIPAELEDESWTPEVAAQTAVAVGRLTTPDDKALVRGVLLGILLPFLESGLAPLKGTAPSSSPPASPALEPQRESLEAASSMGNGRT